MRSLEIERGTPLVGPPIEPTATAAASFPDQSVSRPLLPVFRDIVIYGVGDLLLRASSFITLPIYTRLFTPADYGTMAVVLAVTGMITALLALGGDSAYARHYFEAKTSAERRTLTSTWIWFLLGWTAAVVLLLVAVSGSLASLLGASRDADVLFVLAFLGVPLSLVSSILGQVLRNQFRARTFSMINVTYALVSIGLSLLAAGPLGLGLRGVFAGALAATLLFLPVRWWCARDHVGLEFSTERLRRLLAFGLPLVPVSVAYWIFGTSDRVMLSRMASLSEAGLYAVANNIVGVLAIMHGALGQAWSPYLVKGYEADADGARVFAGEMLSWIVAVFGAAAVLVTLFSREILTLLASRTFIDASAAISPLALGYVAYASTQVTAAGISLTKRTKYLMLYAWVAALVNIALNVLLIPRWGMLGASWATAAAYLSLTLGCSVTTHRLWPVTWERGKLLSISGIILGMMALAPMLPSGGGAGFTARAFAMSVCGGLLWVALLGWRSPRDLGGRVGFGGGRDGA